MSYTTIYNFIPPCPCGRADCHPGPSNWVERVSIPNKKVEEMWEEKAWVQEYNERSDKEEQNLDSDLMQYPKEKFPEVMRSFGEHLLSVMGFMGGSAKDRNWYIFNSSPIDRCVVATCFIDLSDPSVFSTIRSPDRRSSNIFDFPSFSAAVVAEVLLRSRHRFTKAQWFCAGQSFTKWTRLSLEDAVKLNAGASLQRRDLIFRPWSCLERAYSDLKPRN